MLKDNIILKGASGSYQYVLTGQIGTESKRVRNDSQYAEPKTLLVRHTTQGKGIDAVDRHNVQISNVKKDGQGVLRTSIINLTIAAPREGFTNADLQEQLDQLFSLFRTSPSNLDVEASVVSGGSNAALFNAILLGES